MTVEENGQDSRSRFECSRLTNRFSRSVIAYYRASQKGLFNDPGVLHSALDFMSLSSIHVWSGIRPERMLMARGPRP